MVMLITVASVGWKKVEVAVVKVMKGVLAVVVVTNVVVVKVVWNEKHTNQNKTYSGTAARNERKMWLHVSFFSLPS